MKGPVEIAARVFDSLIPLCLLALGSLGPIGGARAADDSDIERAERLARTHWFEGVPYELARELRRPGIARLAAILADPDAAAHHANALIALGMSERREAFPALRRFAAREPRGEIDAAAYRARMALPFALGHLARGDRRALELLIRLAERERPPSWSHRHLSGASLRALLERSALSALGLSGRREASDLLDRRRAAARGRDPRLERHAETARRLCERVAAEGPRQVLRRRGRP